MTTDQINLKLDLAASDLESALQRIQSLIDQSGHEYDFINYRSRLNLLVKDIKEYRNKPTE